MNASLYRAAWSAAILACWVVAPATAVAAGKVLSVEEFNRVSAKLVGLEVTVEGRWTQLGADKLKFRNCEVLFRSEGPLATTLHKGSNLEITGQLNREKGKLVVAIRSLRELPSDQENALRQRREIYGESAAAAEAWHKLADWSAERGRFYRDSALLEESAEARTHALNIERRNLIPDDAAARFSLAGRIRDPRFDAMRLELVHEGLQLERARRAKAEEPNWEEFAKEIAERLPGAEKPLARPLPQLRADYLAHPVDVYAKTDAVTRPALLHMLWGDAMLRHIERQAAPDGSNGFEIADAIDRTLPELHSVAESYRDKALATRAEKVGKMSRADVLALREDYRRRNQPRQGQEVLESWLTLRRKELPPGDVEGLLDLAEQYTSLLERPEMAARLLLEAAAQQADSREIASRLERLGYERKDGRWLKASQAREIPEDALQKALREGRVELGMTRGQVEKSLGKPAGMTRFASAGQVGEIWTYGGEGSRPLVIYLVKTASQSEARVIALDQL